VLVAEQGHAELVGDGDGRVATIGRNGHPDRALGEHEQEVTEIAAVGAYRQYNLGATSGASSARYATRAAEAVSTPERVPL
jgi:hypothetical protein